MSNRPAPLLALLLLLLLGQAAARPTVVVSIHPWFDITRQIAGDAADVVRILPPAASPHTFEPAPSDIRRVAAADLLVMNGGIGVDEWLLTLLAASGNDAPLLVLMDEVELEPVVDEHAHDHDHDHAEARTQEPEGFTNPHIWLDPLLALQAAQAIEDALVQLDPAGESGYRANGERLREDLLALDGELQESLAPLQGAAFVPFHNAWPYFARRYGLDLVLEIEPFPGREPSPAYIIEVLRSIERSGAQAIFTEPQLFGRSAQAVAEAASLPLYQLDPIGGTGELQSYQELMRHNASVLLEALGP